MHQVDVRWAPGRILGLLVSGIFLLGSLFFEPSARAGENLIIKHVANAIIDNLDLTPGVGNDVRATIKFSLQQGINIDNQGNQTTIWFILTDISDESLARRMGLAFGGVLAQTPGVAMSKATLTGDIDGVGGQWIFFGDLPNPIPSTSNPTPIQNSNNDYSPLRQVVIGGNTVVVNAIFVKWGPGDDEQMRIDNSCISFPDNPPNSSCKYNGAMPGDPNFSGHVLDLDTTSLSPSVTFKLHKSRYETSYLPYYIVTDAFPAGPANAMGVPFVPKNRLLGSKARPIVQSLPPALSPNNLPGGGPLGGQVGLPAYFLPGSDYTPMWHIRFIRWNIPQTSEIKSLKEAFDLQKGGALGIFEFNPSPPPIGSPGKEILFNPDNPNPPHVVNCPVPLTVNVSGL